MHSIERYGIVALLFLVVTVIAVLMWDGGKAGKEPEKRVAAGAPARRASDGPARERQPRAVERGTVDPRSDEPGTDEPGAAEAEPADAERRLSLSAPSQPGPLFRDARPEPEATDAAAPGGTDEVSEPAAPAAGESAESPGVQKPRERPRTAPVQDPVLAATPTHAYTVRAGDTLSEIAERELGSSRRWSEIVAVNPGLDPARLRLGTRIKVPGAAPVAAVARTDGSVGAQPAAARKDSAVPGGKTWKVGKGENLWKIAERALGDGKRWREIAALNPGLQPDKLRLGQVLKLPGKAATAPAAPRKEPTKTLVASAAATERASRRGGKVK